MSDHANPDPLFDKIRGILVETLGLEAAEIVPSARVMIELGAESIDLLDLRFRLEKAFGFRISNDDLSRAFSETRSPEEFRASFTVEALCRYVALRLGQPVA